MVGFSCFQWLYGLINHSDFEYYIFAPNDYLRSNLSKKYILRSVLFDIYPIVISMVLLAALGRTDLLQLLHAKGASLYAQDREGHNLLHYLSLFPSPTHPATSLFLEDQRIRPRPDFSPLFHIPSASGVTPLHIAAITGSLDLFRELLAHECSVDSFDKHLRSPLSYAAILGRNEVQRDLYSPELSRSDLISVHK